MAATYSMKRRVISKDGELRENIRSSDLVILLENHCFGMVSLEKSQVSAALGLLKKTLPDIQMITVDVEGGVDINVLQVKSHPKPKRANKPASK